MRYVNPHQRRIKRGFTHFLLWQLGFYKDKERPLALPKDFCYPNAFESVDDNKPCVTWVNHSTFWVKGSGKSLLFDPIWNERCSPLPFIGPKRHHLPTPRLESITTLDAVVISHNHYDHLDYTTVKLLTQQHPKTLWIVPMGVKKWFAHHFPSARVKELFWWEKYEHGSLAFTAVPAQHFSGRGLFDRNSTLWMGCVVEFDQIKRVYFAGDTGYNAFDFKEIRNRFSRMDLSLIPIGVYRPRPFMQPVHVNPYESVKIHLDVGSGLSVAGHFGTFHLSSEEMERPPFDLYQALTALRLSPSVFRVLSPGQTVNW